MNKRIKTGESNVDGTLQFIDTTSSQTNAKPNIGGSLLLTEYDLERLYDWINDDNRKPSVTAFTSGVARNIASAIEFKFSKQ